MSKIKVENLSYVYMTGGPYEKKALNNINVDIKQGEFIGIIGHTGSGKSTLVQHFNGLLKPSSGKIFYDGINIYEEKYKLRDLRYKVGLIFQYPEHQLFEETVYKDIAFGPKNMGLDEKEIEKRVYESMDLVGLDNSILLKSPFDLSGGQKRRVAIAGVLALDPEVLVLDEPTAGLDPQGRDEILGKIKALKEEKGKTVILVSHSMEDIAKLCQRVIVMENGTIFADDTMSNIFKREEELIKLGLSVPQITILVNRLRKKGINIGEDIFTVPKAKDELVKLLKRGDQNV